MKVDGSGACSVIKIEADVDPKKTNICPRTDCQTATGTAFWVPVPIPGATLKVTGMPATYLKTTAESGNPRLQAFCGTFGSPIYSTSPGESVQPLYVLRVGILCQRDRFAPRRQIGWRSTRP